MAAASNDGFVANLIGFWDFLKGSETQDTGLADGIAQNGTLQGNATISDGRLTLDWDGCSGGVFEVDGEDVVAGHDAPFDLAEGSLRVRFTQHQHVGSAPDTILNRGEYADRATEGFFELRVTCDGRVETLHQSGCDPVVLSSASGFFCPGDTVQATYVWSDSSGATLRLENLSAGTEALLTSATPGLTLAIGDKDDEAFAFGAREADDGLYDRYFDGSIDYVAVYNTDILSDPIARDGIVLGTRRDDLIDIDYTGDPDGDRIDAGDAILPGQAPDDDIVKAGSGNDTVEAGEGSDEVFGERGDDSIGTGNSAEAPDRGYPGLYGPDADPFDDRDSVFGGDGADTIRTGDDADLIRGGRGNDVIYAGVDDDDVDGEQGDDLIVGGEGRDLILGGAGDDTIYAGSDPADGPDPTYIEDDGSGPSEPDARPDNDMDIVFGGDGDDVIFGGDDSDTLRGEAGEDLIDGQIDDDVIFGDGGEDTLLGGQGADLIHGGQGEDTIDGGSDDDTLFGDSGDDEVYGGSGDDLIDGGGGGNDLLFGGADADTFVNAGAGDVVDGGSGGEDFDTLDLRGTAPEGGGLRVTITGPDLNGNGFDGYVTFFGPGGPDTGRLDFSEIENIVPCFTPGTRIATPLGARAVETLKPGDMVITRDNGIQPIRWVGSRSLTGAELAAASHLRPIRIRKGALEHGMPDRDMLVSPNHRLLVSNGLTALYFEESEVLVAAKHLTGVQGIEIAPVRWVTYVHIMFDRHEVILSDGAWTESFQPGDQSLAGIGNAQRNEIFELFPELRTRSGLKGYAAARRSLKRYEAALLTE